MVFLNMNLVKFNDFLNWIPLRSTQNLNNHAYDTFLIITFLLNIVNLTSTSTPARYSSGASLTILLSQSAVIVPTTHF